MLLNTLLDQGVTVLTASRRLAHALRLNYAEYQQRRGQPVWRSPRVLPLSAWLRQQWLEQRASTADSPQLRLLSGAQARVIWDEVVTSSMIAGGLLNPSNAARIAARSWQRLHDYLIPLDAVARAETAEAQALHSWASAFMQRCEDLQAIDEARLSHWAYRARIAPSERVAFAGFDLMTPAIKRLADEWCERDAVVDLSARATSALDVRTVAANDAAGEVELAARWSRSLIERGHANVGIVIAELQQRRHDVRRVFEDVFAPGVRVAGEASGFMPVEIAAPEPLGAYPIIDAAMLCLQLALGGERSTVAGRLLRSPFVAGSLTERDARAMADSRLRYEQRDQWDWFELERWAGVTGCSQLQMLAREMCVMLRGGFAKAPPSRWAERIHHALRIAGWPGERALSSVEHQTVQKFQATLAEFGALDAVLVAIPFREAVAQLRALLQETPFEPEATAAAVTVIDASTVAGMHFDALWVTGLDAARLPPPATPDPLIPLDVQRAAGVPEASPEGTFRLASLQLQRLIGSAASVMLSWPQRDGDAHLQASPLLNAWPQIDTDALLQSQTRALRHSIFAARPKLLVVQDDVAPALTAEKTKGGAMILELQSRCAFRAQAELRLHARPLPRVSLGIEPKDRGTLLHRVLAELWGELKAQHALLAIDDESLATRIRSITERHAAQTLRPATRLRSRLVALEIDNVLAQTLALAALERQRAPFVVRLAEQGERFAIGGLQIQLQADRVDELRNGDQILLDYKLGDTSTPRQWLDAWPGRPRRPQLPLYALAHAERAAGLAFVVLAPGTVEFRGWSREFGVAPGIAVYPPRKPAPHEPPDWQALTDHWRHTLTQLAAGFVAGRAEVDPLPQECQTCHLSSFCRIHERSGRDAEEHADD